jgi:hypothetical protein
VTNDERDAMIRDTHDSVIRMEDKVVSHEKILKGNGSRGLVIEVDRLNGFKRMSCWFICVISVTWITILSKLIYESLRAKNGSS